MADHPCVPLNVDCGAHDLSDSIVLERLFPCKESLAALHSERLPLDINVTVVSFLLSPGHLKNILFEGTSELREPDSRTVGATYGT